MAGSSFRYRLQQIEVGGIYDTALAQEIEKNVKQQPVGDGTEKSGRKYGVVI